MAVERRFRDEGGNGDSWQVVIGVELPIGDADPGRRQGAAAITAAWRRTLPVAEERVRAELTALLAQSAVARVGADIAAHAERDLGAEPSPSAEADPVQGLALRRTRIRLAAQAAQADLRWRATVVAVEDALGADGLADHWPTGVEASAP